MSSLAALSGDLFSESIEEVYIRETAKSLSEPNQRFQLISLASWEICCNIQCMLHPLENELVKFLSCRWSPKLILLAGSRATGAHKENSDWDLYLLGDYSGRDSIPEQYAGQNLDIVIRPIADLNQNVLSTFYGPIPALRVLLDDEDLTGQQIVTATRAAYLRGSCDRDPKEHRADQLELNRYVSKILARLDDLESCFSTFARVHALAIQIWFYDRGRWPLPAHQALPIIRSEDSEFAAQLTAITKSDKSAVEACRFVAEGMRPHG